MQVGILGFPQSGKTTIFNAATRGTAAVSAYSSQNKPNIGVAKMRDPRLDTLTQMHKAPKVVPAEVVYVDMPGAPDEFGKSAGIVGELLSHLQRSDALMIVARGFEDPSVVNERNRIDAVRDIDEMLSELAFADLAVLERRVQRVKDSFKGAKQTERAGLEKEQALLEKMQKELENETHIRHQQLTPEERKFIVGYKFLTDKPIIAIANVGEEGISKVDALDEEMAARFAAQGVTTGALCGKLEMELAQMSPEEETEFRAEMALKGESGLDRMVRLCYEALGQMTFFTAGPKEVHAWTVAKGSDALAAAGRIHSDLQRGFIRAEVMGYEDFVECGTEVEAKKRGKLRQEGKTYVMQDGDIINVLFNV
ncbi:MAG: redox-regulated ATPase YchF [Chloroflexi bacterium]|nr:redox-regulated ATPase YchF [Chloroflexota bacterium]